MKKINQLLPAGIMQFIKFGMVGVVNNAVSLGIYYAVVFFRREWYLFGNALGYVVSIFCAYLLNSRFAFKAEDKEREEGKVLVKTYVMYGVSLLLNTALLYVIVNVMKISEHLAPIVSLMITVPLNFVVSRLWVYR